MGDDGAIADEILVEGLADLNRAFARAGKDVVREVRGVMRGIAEPVRAAAEGNALSDITGIRLDALTGRQPKWHGMRIGVTRHMVYVAPQQRGRLGRANPRLKRKNMHGLLLNRAMLPAEKRYKHQYEARLEHALDQIADRWER